jgi:glutamate synthase (NADPH/NADH) small chain
MAEKKKEEIPRQPMPIQDPDVRVKNFKAVSLGFSPDVAVLEASRCIQCKDPRCRKGCPVGVDIPAFIKCIQDDDFESGIAKIKERNALPAVTGRVCPQETQCEAHCILGKKGEPVGIGRLERFLADWERNEGKVKLPQTAPSTGKKVAVVGSGPSGLTVAGNLILKGHDIIVFEAFHKPGGVLLYGVPEFRLPKEVLLAEIDYLERLGVRFECNSVVGKIALVKDLFDEGYQAIFVGVGAGLPRFLNIPGENLIGIYSANEYLTRSNLMKAYLFPEYDTPIAIGKKVVVIGGGNVALDSARTAVRLGADSVEIIYRRTWEEMPARALEIGRAEEEGIEIHVLINPVRFIGDDEGRVKTVECVKMELGEPEPSGRRRPVPIKSSNFEIECDLVVICVGSGANPLLTSVTPELVLNEMGYILTQPETGKTTMPGVWAGGDIVTGSATVISAMGAGRRAADSMHRYMMWGW